MTEAQLQLLIKILLALAVMLGAFGTLNFFYRKRARKNLEKIEYLNFDETRLRKRNKARKGNGKTRRDKARKNEKSAKESGKLLKER